MAGGCAGLGPDAAMCGGARAPAAGSRVGRSPLARARPLSAVPRAAPEGAYGAVGGVSRGPAAAAAASSPAPFPHLRLSAPLDPRGAVRALHVAGARRGRRKGLRHAGLPPVPPLFDPSKGLWADEVQELEQAQRAQESEAPRRKARRGASGRASSGSPSPPPFVPRSLRPRRTPRRFRTPRVGEMVTAWADWTSGGVVSFSKLPPLPDHRDRSKWGGGAGAYGADGRARHSLPISAAQQDALDGTATSAFSPAAPHAAAGAPPPSSPPSGPHAAAALPALSSPLSALFAAADASADPWAYADPDARFFTALSAGADAAGSDSEDAADADEEEYAVAMAQAAEEGGEGEDEGGDADGGAEADALAMLSDDDESGLGGVFDFRSAFRGPSGRDGRGRRRGGGAGGGSGVAVSFPPRVALEALYDGEPTPGGLLGLSMLPEESSETEILLEHAMRATGRLWAGVEGSLFVPSGAVKEAQAWARRGAGGASRAPRSPEEALGRAFRTMVDAETCEVGGGRGDGLDGASGARKAASGGGGDGSSPSVPPSAASTGVPGSMLDAIAAQEARAGIASATSAVPAPPAPLASPPSLPAPPSPSSATSFDPYLCLALDPFPLRPKPKGPRGHPGGAPLRGGIAGGGRSDGPFGASFAPAFSTSAPSSSAPASLAPNAPSALSASLGASDASAAASSSSPSSFSSASASPSPSSSPPCAPRFVVPQIPAFLSPHLPPPTPRYRTRYPLPPPPPPPGPLPIDAPQTAQSKVPPKLAYRRRMRRESRLRRRRLPVVPPDAGLWSTLRSGWLPDGGNGVLARRHRDPRLFPDPYAERERLTRLPGVPKRYLEAPVPYASMALEEACARPGAALSRLALSRGHPLELLVVGHAPAAGSRRARGGGLLVSRRAAELRAARRRLEALASHGLPARATLLRVAKDEAIVDVMGIQGRVPMWDASGALLRAAAERKRARAWARRVEEGDAGDREADEEGGEDDDAVANAPFPYHPELPWKGWRVAVDPSDPLGAFASPLLARLEDIERQAEEAAKEREEGGGGEERRRMDGEEGATEEERGEEGEGEESGKSEREPRGRLPPVEGDDDEKSPNAASRSSASSSPPFPPSLLYVPPQTLSFPVLLRRVYPALSSAFPEASPAELLEPSDYVFSARAGAKHRALREAVRARETRGADAEAGEGTEEEREPIEGGGKDAQAEQSRPAGPKSRSAVSASPRGDAPPALSPSVPPFPRPPFRPGDLVVGTVVLARTSGAVVDVGGWDAALPRERISRDWIRSVGELFAAGDKVVAVVLEVDERSMTMLLSTKPLEDPPGGHAAAGAAAARSSSGRGRDEAASEVALDADPDVPARPLTIPSDRRAIFANARARYASNLRGARIAIARTATGTALAEVRKVREAFRETWVKRETARVLAVSGGGDRPAGDGGFGEAFAARLDLPELGFDATEDPQEWNRGGWSDEEEDEEALADLADLPVSVDASGTAFPSSRAVDRAPFLPRVVYDSDADTHYAYDSDEDAYYVIPADEAREMIRHARRSHADEQREGGDGEPAD